MNQNMGYQADFMQENKFLSYFPYILLFSIPTKPFGLLRVSAHDLLFVRGAMSVSIFFLIGIEASEVCCTDRRQK